MGIEVDEAKARIPVQVDGESWNDWWDRVYKTDEYRKAEKLREKNTKDFAKSSPEKKSQQKNKEKTPEQKGNEFVEELIKNTELARQTLEYGRALDDETFDKKINSLLRKIMRALAYDPKGERPQLEADVKLESYGLHDGYLEGLRVFYLEFELSNQQSVDLHYEEIGRIIPYLGPEELQFLKYCLVEGKVSAQKGSIESNQEEIKRLQKQIEFLQGEISDEEEAITEVKDWLMAVEKAEQT